MGSSPVAVAKIVTLGKFCMLCFLVTIIFLRFGFLPYYQRIKAVVSKIILGAVSGCFEKNLLQTNLHISTVFYFLFFLYLSTFLILLNLFHANNPFLYAPKRSENFRFSGVFRGYMNGSLAWNGLTMENAWNLNVRHSINRSVFYNKQ